MQIALPPEMGGFIDPSTIPASVLDAEAMDDMELREKIVSGIAPTVDNIFRFLSFRLFQLFHF